MKNLACLGPLLLCALPASTTPRTSTVDFDAALAGLRFDPARVDGNAGVSMQPNGILDAHEMAVVAAILADEALDLSRTGGVTHAAVRAAYDQALASAGADTAPLAKAYPTVATVVAGYAMLGEPSFDAIATMSASFGAPLKGDYALAKALGSLLGPEGDADGDGASNLLESRAHPERSAYVHAVLDPEVVPSEADVPAATYWCPMRGRPCEVVDHAGPGSCPSCGMALVPRSVLEGEERRTVGIVLYPGFEPLDVYGPLEMWGYVRELELVTIAETAGPVRSAHGVATVADRSFADAPELDILFVPGGMGTMAQLANERFIDFLAERHARAEITASVCTGSALLAKAGILDGKRATSNKLHFSLAVEQSDRVEWVRRARWVDDGDVITSSGVSAGMDMALALVARLHGEERAREVARWAEYVWSSDPGDDPFAAAAEEGGH